jgi:hypothetical protein
VTAAATVSRAGWGERAAAGFEQALGWCLDRGITPPGLAPEHLRELREMLRGQLPWDAEFAPKLLFFSLLTAHPEMRGKLPRLGPGDALDAVDALLASRGASWSCETHVDPAVVQALGFGEVSTGIQAMQRRHREGWWEHGRKKRAFIEEALGSVGSRRETAAILGAGQAYDLPIDRLLDAFDRLVLVDIDGPALEATVGRLVKDPARRGRIETRARDVTGVNAELVRRCRPVVETAIDADQACFGLAALLDGYHLARKPCLLEEGETADLLVSDLMLTQLASQHDGFLRAQVEKRHGPPGAAAGALLRRAWGTFAHRVQQDHIDALCDQAAVAVLLSDVLLVSTALDPAGIERPTGERRTLVGAPALRDRVPGYLEVLGEASWTWCHSRPERGGSLGLELQVHALRLRWAGLPQP